MANQASTREKLERIESSFAQNQTASWRELRLENTILTKLTSIETSQKFFVFSKRQDIAFVRGIASAVGACFGFLSLLKITPDWTSFIYFGGLLPEMLKLLMHVDISAHRMLIREFEYIVVVLSSLLFASIMISVLLDLRAVVPITMFFVVLSSQAQDASIPFEQHKLSAAIYYLVGGLACVAVYILIQFGFVPDLIESELSFGGANGKSVTVSNVQFACDRLITAAFFLFKQAWVAYFFPGCFVTLRSMVNKKIVLINEGNALRSNAIVSTDASNNPA
jgi:hypothetical protein